jgi:RNA polymerase sigma-70 factor (ECF subfamily)
MDRPPLLSEQAIKRLKAKEPKAFEQLYDRYAPPLYGLIISVVKDQQLAEGALQDTFIKIWRNIDMWDNNKSQLFTWMFSIARNTAIDYVRKQSKAQIVNVEQGLQIPGDSDNQTALEHVELTEMLGNLDPKYQEVIKYLYLKGWTQREMAQQTGIPLGTIKSRVSKALELLRGRYTGTRIASLLSLLIMMSNGQ